MKRIFKSWLFKRIIINVAMLLLTGIVIVLGSIIVSVYLPSWKIAWFAFVFIYGMFSQIVHILVIDEIIGPSEFLKK